MGGKTAKTCWRVSFEFAQKYFLFMGLNNRLPNLSDNRTGIADHL